MKNYIQQSSLILLILSALTFYSCNQEKSSYTKIEPAQIDHIEGSELSKLTLTEKAAERIGIKTASVTEVPVSDSDATLQKVVPYSSVLYDTDGKTWVYTNPNPLVYVRQEINISFIKGMKAFLTAGPKAGVSIVTQGAAELLGTEFHVGH